MSVMATITGPDEPQLPKLSAQQISFFYGDKRALNNVSLDIPANQVTAFIGPSGCGKSTFLRCFNRMNELIDGSRIAGRILLDGRDIYAPSVDVVSLRKDVGMVFQKPNPFADSIFKNVAFGPKIHGIPKREWPEIVEKSLIQAALWEEVKDDLTKSAFALSGGQQQRLCIARTLAVQPKVILMDEPCSALDPIATSRIEDLIYDLKQQYTIVIVTHNMHQAQRASDITAFFMHGELIEMGVTQQIFLSPKDERTEGYISGRFG